MREIQKRLERLEKLEKKVAKNNFFDPEIQKQIRKSAAFFFANASNQKRLSRELTEEENIELARRLYENGEWKLSWGQLIVKLTKQIESKRKNGDNQ